MDRCFNGPYRRFLVVGQRKAEHPPLVAEYRQADDSQHGGKHVYVALLHGIPQHSRRMAGDLAPGTPQRDADDALP